jgi:hypothetical protein
MNLNLRPPVPADAMFRHVIDQYKHRAQEITCTCGWRGSSASPEGQPSEWKQHLAATRPPGASRR